MYKLCTFPFRICNIRNNTIGSKRTGFIQFCIPINRSVQIATNKTHRKNIYFSHAIKHSLNFQIFTLEFSPLLHIGITRMLFCNH